MIKKRDLQEAVLWYPIRNGTIVEVLLPVLFDCRELVDTHENGEPKKGSLYSLD